MKYPLFNPYTSEEMELITKNVISSKNIATGKYVDIFEDGLKEMVGCPYLVTTNNMSSALFLALWLAGVRRGDEVLTTSFACMATNAPISWLGATPVWLDLAKNSLFIDSNLIEQNINDKTKAIIVYHIAGYPTPMEDIRVICKRKGIKIIEDCNNALLAKDSTGIIGSSSDYSIYSFYPNRQINGIDGGALICQKHSDYIIAKKMIKFGIDTANFRDSNGEIKDIDISNIGWSITMNNLNCAVAATQLSTVENRIEKTVKNANLFNSIIKSKLDIQEYKFAEGSTPSYWALILRLKGTDKEKLISNLRNHEIQASSLHYSNDTYSGFGSKKTDLHNTYLLQKELLALPIGFWMSESDIYHVASTFIIEYKNSISTYK
ncbi:DegT/DnrJ/EryC1/StrS family aminotransferase [Morganella morganii subsp. sibonii]|nr:pyridoxal-phosphate-dependent/plp-dependent aminotransferase [Morganella morganii]